MAGRIWSQYLQDDAVFNIHVMATDELPSTVIGGAIPELGSANVAGVEYALNQDATSDSDAVAIANLGTTVAPNGGTQFSSFFNDIEYQTSDLAFTYANAKALGWQGPLDPNMVDGYVIFNDLAGSSYSWDYDFTRGAEASSQQLDFLGMALHELGHIMGFTSGLDIIDDAYNPGEISKTSLFDLFRYSERSTAQNAKEFTIGQEAYFSIDGGQTSLGLLSTGFEEDADGVSGFQASHWASELLDSVPTQANDTASQPNSFDFPVLSTIFELSPLSLFTGLPALTPEFTAIPGFSSGFFDPGTIASDLFNPLGQVIVPVSDPSQLPESIGIMDPIVVPGLRSEISELDLLALDVIGYDVSDAATSAVDYNALLQETEQTLAQKIGVDVNDLSNGVSGFLTVSPLMRDMGAELENLFERRRSRGRSQRRPVFQSLDSAPIVSNDSQPSDSPRNDVDSVSNDFQESPSLTTELEQQQLEQQQLEQQQLEQQQLEKQQDVPQSVMAQNITLGSPQSLSAFGGIPVDQLISYGYEQLRMPNQSNLNQNQVSQLTSSEIFDAGALDLFETDSVSADSIESFSSGMLGSRRPFFLPGGSVDAISDSNSPWTQSIAEILGIENIQATLANWLGY